jgi:raffinose/stachyose/melibiose transport system substrate-binding protein
LSKRRSKATLGLLGCVVLLAASYTAASAVAAPKKTQAGSITMVMNAQYKPGMDILIANFKRVHPGIDVKASYVTAGAPYNSLVATQFAAGNGSDILWSLGARSGPTAVWPFAEAGHLANLSGSKWVKRMFPGTKWQLVYNKKVYAWDMGFSALALINYNKTYFDDNNLKPPTTFAGLLSLCKTISDKGKIPIIWGGASQAVNNNDMITLAGNTLLSKDPNWLAKKTAGKTTFAATAGWRRALQMIVDMKNAKCFAPGVEAVGIPQMQQQYASGQGVMMYTSPAVVTGAQVLNPNLKNAMAAMPAEKAADTRLTLQDSGGLAIWSKSAHLTAAKTFVTFFAREAQSRLFARTNNQISAFDAVKGRVPDAYQGIAAILKNKKQVLEVGYNAMWPNTQMNTLTGASIQGLFTGQKSVDDVLADMDKFFALKD